ncbi:dihydroxyacetone kinase subunit L [Aerococcaceae bacterium DSM 111022]|nr:dihydroxyacetone kinase subunit L [Aerococcaceae bacterium DSM 111022]MBG9988411.1 dihydroxyacetone kinase subunit L [Aerococcaceae bacterium DSM 111176]
MSTEKFIKWMTLFHDKIQAEKVYLTELDGPIGDSDHGSNMARGLTHVKEALDTGSVDTPQAVLKTTAMQLMSKVGGASGALYGSAFMGMATAVGADADNATDMIQAGIDMIQKRGKAEAGEKTMLDVWIPVQEAVASGSLTVEVIKDAVESTEPMKATKGRASYVGERSVGHIDPGAMSSGYLFETAIEAGVL